MKMSKTRLKSIIREERSRIISERIGPERVRSNVYEMGSRENGVDLKTLNSMYGNVAFDAVDELQEEGLGILDEEEGVFYTMKSLGIQKMLQRRGLS